MKRVIVVPDVHGRTFWRIIKTLPDTEEIVFLGDYLDPYEWEDISFQEALREFKDILDFARNNKDRVHLLLGNHDGHYIGLSNDMCRFNFQHCHELYDLYEANKDLFKLVWRWEDTVFSHAGIQQGWLLENDLLEKAPDILLAWINSKLIFSKDWISAPDSRMQGETTDNPIQNCGYARGGYSPYGSPIWSDIREMAARPALEGVGISQVFGHSQLKDTGNFLHDKNIWACDSRAVFEWDGENLSVLKGE